MNIFTNIFKNKQSSDESLTESDDYSPIIRVVGPRSSGKTVYLAALARWPNADPSISPVQSVIPINDNGERLIERAKNLLEQGEEFLSTGSEGLDIDIVRDYGIQITLKKQFAWSNLKGRNSYHLTKLNINCKDYPGEFFNDILYKTGETLLQDYLQDCLLAEGIMLLLDGMGYRQDTEFANGLERFLVQLDRAGQSVNSRRIALVITKCEQPELWVNRYNSRKIINARFKQVFRHLKNWESSSPGSVEYFTASAFGMVGNQYPEPNMKCLKRQKEGITSAVLKYPSRWKPFGLVAPIYWLCTGQRHELLDKE